MTVVSVRLNKEEEKAINGYATLTGQPVSQLLKQALLREIEDKVDYTIGVEALEEHKKKILRHLRLLRWLKSLGLIYELSASIE